MNGLVMPAEDFAVVPEREGDYGFQKMDVYRIVPAFYLLVEETEEQGRFPEVFYSLYLVVAWNESFVF